MALAGTIFFSTSVDQARGRVVLFLIITMAPFAVLAPFIGPALDRIQQGRRFVLAGTMLTRGLLCYAMSANVANSVTLLPAAFGILVLQKAGGVVKASVTPRLLPAEITLVTANARSGLISIAASTAAAGLAAGVQFAGGAAWTLRVGTLIYLAAMILALRLPEQIDVPARGRRAGPAARRSRAHAAGHAAPHAAAGARAEKPDARRGSRTARWRTLASVGPVVAEAMTVNAVLRAFSGYILFLLAFLLRSVNLGTVFGHEVSHNFALGALALGLSVGSLASMVLGSFFRGRAPQLIMFSVLAIAPVVTAVLRLAIRPVGGRRRARPPRSSAPAWPSSAQDSIVGREIGDEIRSSTFAVSETLNQVANVAGGLAGVLVSMLDNGQAGLGIAAGGLLVALVLLVLRRRQRVAAAERRMPPPAQRREHPLTVAVPAARSRRPAPRACARSAGAQCLGRRQLGRLDGGVCAGQRAGAERDAEPARDRGRGQHEGLARRDRVAGRGRRPEQHPDGPAEHGQQQRLGEELRRDVPAGPRRARGAGRSRPRRSSTEITMMLAMPIAADRGRDAAEAEEQPGERGARACPGRQDARTAGSPARPRAAPGWR